MTTDFGFKRNGRCKECERRAAALVVASGVFVLMLVSIGTVRAQAPPGGSGIVQGTVRDAQNHPVAGAMVHLDTQGSSVQTTHTDTMGAYRFSALSEGHYTIRAEMDGYSKLAPVPVTLGKSQTLTLDLTFRSPAPGTMKTGLGTPDFYDEPQFTVAGVTDTTNLGGHGSDTVLRTRESLAKATATLGKESPKNGDETDRGALTADAAQETALRNAVDHDPSNFDANHRLGKMLNDRGDHREALEFLDRAAELRPGDFANGSERARANFGAGNFKVARAQTLGLLSEHEGSAGDTKGTAHPASEPQTRERALLYRLLGDIDEALADPLSAVHNYQRAAELDPSERNLFAWGAELLLHHAPEPAIEVFAKGVRRYPQSGRMLIGRGAAWFNRGAYEKASADFCAAADLNPSDPDAYLFLGRIEGVTDTLSDDGLERLRRFAQLHPERAQANFYYALALWNRRSAPEGTKNVAEVEALLQKAVPLPDAYLQLGMLYAERQDFVNAIVNYHKAIEGNPDLEKAHYRLAQAYRRTGQPDKAQKELELYQQAEKKKADSIEREHHEIQQFVYTLKEQPPTPQAR